jgi:membrane protease YdiL (CAAX protease family)
MFSKLSTWVTVATAILVVFISVQLAEKKFRASGSDITRNNTHSTTFIVLYFILRILFIAAYECWFRGYLLNDSIESIGLLWAIILNIVLYCVLHIVNGRAEVVACIPFGLLLCALCLWTGTVWPAIVIHLALTIPYEWSYLRKIKTPQKLPYEYTDNRRVGLSRQ